MVVAEHVEAAIEVVPLPVTSERALCEEMDAVARGLAASEEQWQARVEALQVGERAKTKRKEHTHVLCA